MAVSAIGEEDKEGTMAVEKSSAEEGRQEPLIRSSPSLSRINGYHEKRRMSGASLREQFGLSSPDVLQPSAETHQLPTPDPFSPESSSTPLVVTDVTSADLDCTLTPKERKLSASFEYLPHERDGDTSPTAISSPRPISKNLPTHELHKIPEEKVRKVRRPSVTLSRPLPDDKVLKLSPSQIEELTGAPESLPITQRVRHSLLDPERQVLSPSIHGVPDRSNGNVVVEVSRATSTGASFSKGKRPSFTSRAISTPLANRLEPAWDNTGPRLQAPSLDAIHRPSRGEGEQRRPSFRSEPAELLQGLKSPTIPAGMRSPLAREEDHLPSPVPQEIPIPPMSIPTYLQLELASSRPSPLYIHRSAGSEYPYESSKVKFQRLVNFLLVPPQLEHVLAFGSFACLDAWLHTFTILPLRFLKALSILVQWWSTVLATEAQFISGFIYHGAGRMWHRRHIRGNRVDVTSESRNASRPPLAITTSYQSQKIPEGNPTNGTPAPIRVEGERKPSSNWVQNHKRSKSQPSNLSPYHKADLLQGAVIVSSCIILMYFDASRMYHSIRGQSAVKLYMLWNVLEVGDRLLAALGQDVFECLFCEETIERGPDGRSKLLRPFGMFILALIYNVIHAAILFYQVIALNVAVNSYSNALLTLLMSNMFVEIKSTVFKKFEKDNIFQLTCADIVERFQLWLMLVIIAMRNMVEVGGMAANSTGSTAPDVSNNNTTHTNFILPNSFTILPNWAGEVLSPFLLVMGSEMIVDWLKHAYINKFNNVKPALYQKFLDVLAKDYYTNAFVNQNLTKRLGLPVIPLSCLFIRASVQTYHMFLATHLPTPIPTTETELALESEATASPVTTAALQHFDAIIRRALGRSTFGSGVDAVPKSWFMLGTDDIIAFLTMLIVFLCAFLVLLACKLVLGMLLLAYARNRYSSMKEREHLSLDAKGKRLGGWGVVEVDEDKRRWIYEDDSEGARASKERERKASSRARDGERGTDFARVTRYEMSAKRIW